MKNRYLFILVMFVCLSISNKAQQLPQPVLKNGFPRLLTSGPYSNFGNPITYDFDGDGKQEIVLSTGYWIEVIRNNGENFFGWPKNVSIPVYGFMAVGDVDWDGYKEIVATGFTPGGKTGAIYIWRFTGDEYPGFPKIVTVDKYGIVGCPVLYDIEGDNVLEIITSVGNKVFIYKIDGSVYPGWPQGTTDRYIGVTPMVGDIDRDGRVDIVAASGLFSEYDSVDALRVYNWESDGTLKPGWPFYYKGNDIGFDRFGAIGPISDDGKYGIAFGSGYSLTDLYNCNFFVINSKGELVNGWPVKAQRAFDISYGVSLVDVDRSGELKIVSGDLRAYMYVWHNNGNNFKGWPYKLPSAGNFRSSVTSSPGVYIDIENRNYTIFVKNSYNILDSADGEYKGYIFAIRGDSTQESWSPIRPIGIVGNTPIFADLEGDGTVELIAYTSFTQNSVTEKYLYVWEFPGIPFDKEHFPWPLPLYNRWNTGEFGFEPTDTLVVAVRNEKGNPTETKLYPNYPNPFNVSTKIRYELKSDGNVKLSVYNTLGQHLLTIVDSNQKAGTYEAIWDARKYPSGVYYAKLETEGYVGVQKLLFIK